MENLRIFNTEEEYQEWKDGDDYVFPNVCKVGDNVIYNGYPEPFWVEALEDINVRYSNGYWSYDKINWTQFSTSDVTLRLGEKLYIYSTLAGQSLYISGKYNVGGSILSLEHGLDYLNYDSHSISLSYYLFNNAKSVVNAKELVLATTLQGTSSSTSGMYYGLFKNCTLLETAPKLPATSLTAGCYNEMFLGCSSLRKAPSLLATNATPLDKKTYYYKNMFYGCSNLSYIKMLLDIPFVDSDTAGSWSRYWVNEVSSTGTFIASSKRTDFRRGATCIPEGWDLYLYDEDNDRYVVKFKVNNIPYEFYTDEPRYVKWNEFINSEYNTNNFIIGTHNNSGIVMKGEDFVLLNNDKVGNNANIVLNAPYTIGQPTETTEE